MRPETMQSSSGHLVCDVDHLRLDVDGLLNRRVTYAALGFDVQFSSSSPLPGLREIGSGSGSGSGSERHDPSVGGDADHIVLGPMLLGTWLCVTMCACRVLIVCSRTIVSPRLSHQEFRKDRWERRHKAGWWLGLHVPGTGHTAGHGVCQTSRKPIPHGRYHASAAHPACDVHPGSQLVE